MNSTAYLFFTFLKIGCVSFGGHMALVAIVEKEMVEKDARITREELLNAISIASVLPGPLAVNVVAYIGYHIQGKFGLMVSMLGVLLPACVLMYILSWSYFNYIHLDGLSDLLLFTVSAVSAVILSAGLNIYHKEVKGNTIKIALCILSILLLYFVKGFLVILVLMAMGGLAGTLFKLRGQQGATLDKRFRWRKLSFNAQAGLFSLSILYLSFVTEIYKLANPILLQIVAVFSGISLSLFGGGYVMVPIMQALFVNELSWLTNQEFIDSIAFSQLTPGPILVGAFFVGYKLAGIAGAILATLAIFTPSAILMIIAAKIVKENANSPFLKNVLAGIKPVVVGMILASAFKLLLSVDYTLISIALFLVAFILSYRFKISPVYLILLSLLFGLIVHFLPFFN